MRGEVTSVCSACIYFLLGAHGGHLVSSFETQMDFNLGCEKETFYDKKRLMIIIIM